MSERTIYRPLKIFSYLVLLLMAAAIVYSSYISVRYWSGIGV